MQSVAQETEVLYDARDDEYTVHLADNLTVAVRHIGIPVKGAMFATVRDRVVSNAPPKQTEADGLRCYARMTIFAGRGVDRKEYFGVIEYLNEGDVREVIKLADLVGDTAKIISAMREIYKTWLTVHFDDGLDTLRKSFSDALGIVNKSDLLRHTFAIARNLKQLQARVEDAKLNMSDPGDLDHFSKKWAWVNEAAAYLDDVPVEKESIDAVKDIVKRWYRLVKA